jgi:hypothetical protein
MTDEDAKAIEYVCRMCDDGLLLGCAIQAGEGCYGERRATVRTRDGCVGTATGQGIADAIREAIRRSNSAEAYLEMTEAKAKGESAS